MEPVIHHTVNPEYFEIHKGIKPGKVKSMYLSCDASIVPQIITETPSKILSSVFKEEKPICLFFKDGYHMYASPLEQYLGMYPNPIATFILRKSNMVSFKQLSTDVICGNVVFFGTVNLKTQQLDNKDYSVPYQLVEESLRIYNIERLY